MNHLLESLYAKIENLFPHRYWKVQLFVLAVIWAYFFHVPNLTYLNQQADPALRARKWVAVCNQIEAPFTQQELPPGSNEEKRVFRLTLPLIAGALNLSVKGIYYLFTVMGLGLILLSILLTYQITQNKATTVFFTFGLVSIYYGFSGFIDVLGFGDILGYFFLLCAIYFRQPLLIFLSLQLAAWTDERALIASSLVFIWWLVQDKEIDDIQLSKAYSIPLRSAIVVLSWIAYFAERAYLIYGVGLETKTAGVFKAFWSMTDKLGLAIWTGFEGYWILILLLFVLLIVKRKYYLLILSLGSFLIISAVSISIHDVTRSYTYGFVILFIGLYLIHHYWGKESTRNIALLCFVVSFLFPSIYIINTIMYTSPVYIEFLYFLRANFL